MNISNDKKAFSLIEVVVVIGIVVVGMLGVSSLMLQNLQAENIDRDNLVASMLAQEGLELVRNQRDLNWLTGGAVWTDRIIGDGGGDSSYMIDYYPGDVEINFYYGADNINDANLQIDPYGFYAHDTVEHGSVSGWPDTNFYRLIEVADNLANGYLEIKCTVRFFHLGQPKDYVATTHLYSWRY